MDVQLTIEFKRRGPYGLRDYELRIEDYVDYDHEWIDDNKDLYCFTLSEVLERDGGFPVLTETVDGLSGLEAEDEWEALEIVLKNLEDKSFRPCIRRAIRRHEYFN